MNTKSFLVFHIIGLSTILVLVLSGCAVKNKVSNSQIIATENPLSKELSDYSAGNEIIFAINAKDRGTLNKCTEKGNNQQVLYEHKAGYISNINVSGNWIIFALTETKEENSYGTIREVSYYYICRLKIDGSCFEKISETRIEDMWVYENKIYFSKYSKSGAKGIFCMDINGKNEKLLFDEENIWFEISNKIIYCMTLGELTIEDEDVDLFQLDIGEGSGEFQKIATFKKMSGKMDRICLKDKEVYYLDADHGRLYKTDIYNENTTLLRKGISDFCVQNNKIYCIEWSDNDEEDSLRVLDLDGLHLKSIYIGNLKADYIFNGVLGEWGYFTADSLKCIMIN